MRRKTTITAIIITVILIISLFGCMKTEPQTAENTPLQSASESTVATPDTKPTAPAIQPSIYTSNNAETVNTPTSVTPSNEPPVNNQNTNQTASDIVKYYGSLGAQLVEDIINDLIGGYTQKDIEETLGKPDETANINGVARWYYEQGIELDIVDQNDQPYLFNYIYLDSASRIKINEDIGIGSTRDEILEKYANEINPDDIKNSIIVAGTRDMGIIFIMDNDMVSSIYIATGAYTNPDARDIPE